MIAYNREWLNNLYIRQETASAFNRHFITKEEQHAINEKHPAAFYTPNLFIRIGLFALTIIILLFSFGLVTLVLINTIEDSIGGLAILFGGLGFAALEFMINTKKHYRSGVDDALLWGAAISLFFGISIPNEFGGLLNVMIIFIISSLAALRYADKIMSVVAYLALLGILFYTCVEIGGAAKAIAPFIIMAASLAVYFVIHASKDRFALYSGCSQMVEITALISLYAAGNYYVVRELSNSMFQLNLQPGDTIPFGWLFWIFTTLVPVIYLAKGIQKKDVILIRVGLLLFAAVVFTVRYYHSLLSLEIIMTIAGITLMAVTYGLMKWLTKPVYGFTSLEISTGNDMDKMQIESLILAQTFKPGTDTHTQKFGGGDFGGGGASGEY